MAVGASGCNSGPEQIDIPVLNASTAASAAVAEADKDGDAEISRDEAVAVPSLLAAFDKYDTNNDDRLSTDEIEARIASWTANGPKVVPISFYVKLNGRPLSGAKVVLEPEPFCGDVLPAAESMVSDAGACGPTVPREYLSKQIPVGVFCGLYRIKITHPDKSLPARFNERTELGIEVAPDYDFFNRKTFDLKSK